MDKTFPAMTIAFVGKEDNEAVETFTKVGLTEQEIVNFLNDGYHVELYDGTDTKGHLITDKVWNLIAVDSDGFCGRLEQR